MMNRWHLKRMMVLVGVILLITIVVSMKVFWQAHLSSH